MTGQRGRREGVRGREGRGRAWGSGEGRGGRQGFTWGPWLLCLPPSPALLPAPWLPGSHTALETGGAQRYFPLRCE